MKIERDKWYVMRNGEVTEVTKVNGRGDARITTEDKNGIVRKHYAAGEHETNPDFDLISEHREPARVWVNFYANGLRFHNTEDEARMCAAWDATRIAVEFVEVVNGRDDG